MDRKEFDERRKTAGKWWTKPYTDQNETARIMAMQELLANAVRSLLPEEARAWAMGHVRGCKCLTCEDLKPPEGPHVDGCLCAWCSSKPKVMASRIETCVKCGKQEIDPIGWIIEKSITTDPNDKMYCCQCMEYKGS